MLYHQQLLEVKFTHQGVLQCLKAVDVKAANVQPQTACGPSIVAVLQYSPFTWLLKIGGYVCSLLHVVFAGRDIMFGKHHQLVMK